MAEGTLEVTSGASCRGDGLTQKLGRAERHRVLACHDFTAAEDGFLVVI